VRSESFQDDHPMMLLKLEQDTTARQRYSRTCGTKCCWLENSNTHQLRCITLWCVTFHWLSKFKTGVTPFQGCWTFWISAYQQNTQKCGMK